MANQSIDKRAWLMATGVAASMVLMAGCASRQAGMAGAPVKASSGAAPATAGGPRADTAAPGGTALGAEARWLRELFGDTPVVVTDEPYGVVRLTVPLAHSFEPASAAPKPALKAVLDRLGQSLGRQGTAWVQVGAPGPLSAQRQQAMKSHLTALKVASWRVTRLPSEAQPGAVVIRLLPG